MPLKIWSAPGNNIVNVLLGQPVSVLSWEAAFYPSLHQCLSCGIHSVKVGWIPEWQKERAYDALPWWEMTFLFLHRGWVLPERVLWRINANEVKWTCHPRGPKLWVSFPILSTGRQVSIVSYLMRENPVLSPNSVTPAGAQGWSFLIHKVCTSEVEEARKWFGKFLLCFWWFPISMKE